MDELGQAYADGNSALLEWLTLAREPLSAAISTIENLFDPETIVLGGALPDALIDHLIGSIALAERSVANREIRQHPRLMRGRTGRMTATLGAAAMVIHQAMTPRIAVAQ